MSKKAKLTVSQLRAASAIAKAQQVKLVADQATIVDVQTKLGRATDAKEVRRLAGFLNETGRPVGNVKQLATVAEYGLLEADQAQVEIAGMIQQVERWETKGYLTGSESAEALLSLESAQADSAYLTAKESLLSYRAIAMDRKAAIQAAIQAEREREEEKAVLARIAKREEERARIEEETARALGC